MDKNECVLKNWLSITNLNWNTTSHFTDTYKTVCCGYKHIESLLLSVEHTWKSREKKKNCVFDDRWNLSHRGNSSGSSSNSMSEWVSKPRQSAPRNETKRLWTHARTCVSWWASVCASLLEICRWVCCRWIECSGNHHVIEFHSHFHRLRVYECEKRGNNIRTKRPRTQHNSALKLYHRLEQQIQRREERFFSSSSSTNFWRNFTSIDLQLKLNFRNAFRLNAILFSIWLNFSWERFFLFAIRFFVCLFVCSIAIVS